MNKTRLAPSPTGALHLGNARTFLLTWLLARQRGWSVLLRIEDLDGPRIKAGADRQAVEDLRWLGLEWDEGPVYQSSRFPVYQAAITNLLNAGTVYPCTCTRKEIDTAASAPHAADGAAIYPGTCRPASRSTLADPQPATARPAALRFDTRGHTAVSFTDTFVGERTYDVEHTLGDFVVAKADGTPAYQLAVVVDDADAGVTHVVRGDDLLDSTPRQILLYNALRLGEKIPTYTHLPLVIGPDGRRLAKRHGDTRLATYRQAGTKPERVLALLARWSGVDAGDAVSLDELRAAFTLAKLPAAPITMTPADDTFLRNR